MKKLLVLTVCLFGCASNHKPSDQPEPDPEWCVEAEKTLLRLECKKTDGSLLAAPNIDGVPWRQICEDVQSDGIPLEAECLAGITSCGQVESKCNWTTKENSHGSL